MSNLTRLLGLVAAFSLLFLPVSGDQIDEIPPCPFPQLAQKLQDREPLTLTIVAIGSSSTQGVGASSPAMSYPSQLEAMLRAALPDIEILVYNKGVGGEIAADTFARFDADLLALAPDLAIWQVGTNDARHRIRQGSFVGVLEAGIAKLQSNQVEVALLDLQHVGRLHRTAFARYQSMITETAERLDIPRIPRWEIMRRMIESGQHSEADLFSEDGLHTTDLPYQRTAAYTAELILRCAE